MHNNKPDWYDPSDQSQSIISPHSQIERYLRKLDADTEILLNPCFIMSTTGCDEAAGLQKRYNVREEPFLLPAFLGKRPVYAIDGDPAISLVQRALAAPTAADSLEVAIALGVRRIFLFGLCGAVAADLDIGDIIIPSEIKRLEGTSYHYAPSVENARPDDALAKTLSAFLNEHSDVCFRVGKTVTTDAVYRQTLNKELSWREEGILGVDMEMSALLAVAGFYGLPAVCMLVVSDKHVLEPDSEWHWGGKDLAARQTHALELFVDFIRYSMSKK